MMSSLPKIKEPSSLHVPDSMPEAKVIRIPVGTDINLNQELERLRIDPTAEIDEPPVYCRIGNSPAMTAGNFSMLNGKAKSGKTFFLGALVASLLSDKQQLGVIQGCLPDTRRGILYFDTEQSDYHATRSIKRVCMLAEDANPVHLRAYGLRVHRPEKRLALIEEAIMTSENVGLVVIDGIRDLLTKGINDEEEATRLTSSFLRWTAQYAMHLIVILHQNKNDVNARGHIGTEVINKAETSISISRDSKTGILRVSCDYSRDIAFEDFGFIIRDGLPVGADLPVERKANANDPRIISDEEHIEKLNHIFKEQRRLSVSDFKDRVCYEFQVGENKSREFITHYTNIKGWVIKVREGKHVHYEYQRAIF